MMGKYLVIMRYLTNTICIVLLLWGCDRSAEATAQPKLVRKKVVTQKELIAKVSTNRTIHTAKTTELAAEPRVVRKKVVARKEQTAKVSRNKIVHIEETNQTSRFEEKSTVENIDESQAKVKSKNQAEPKRKTDRQTLVAKKRDEAIPPRDAVINLPALKKSAVRPRSDLSDIKPPSIKDSAAPINKLIAATSSVTPESGKASIPSAYDAIGKVDPFAPLFREKPVAVKKSKGKKKRIPMTPLERIDLSQLKLVGIILASSGNRALVEESTGKGYVIKKGTYIGMNSGKVVKIKKEEVVVEEEIEDVFGKTTLRHREIKLPKPPGEF
jgi:type IV pilus assembly protein PilP